MKLTKGIIANAIALTSGIYWVITYLLMLAIPTPALAIEPGNSLTMMEQLTGMNSLVFFIFGGIIFLALSWLLGYLFGWSLEYFSKKE